MPFDPSDYAMAMIVFRHYIRIDEDSNVIEGWSDAIFPRRDTSEAIVLPGSYSYQFRLTPDGEENPPLYTIDGIPLYRWDGESVIPRTEEEIAADRAARPAPPPSAQEQLRADVDFLAAMQGVSL